MAVAREYEVTTLVRADWTPEQLKSFVGKTTGLVEENGGTILHSVDLGKRTTSYDIEKQGRAQYWYFNFVQSGDVIDDMELTFRHDEGVLRFLTVKVSDEVDVGMRQAQSTEDLQRLEQYFGVQLLAKPEAAVAVEAPVEAAASDAEEVAPVADAAEGDAPSAE